MARFRRESHRSDGITDQISLQRTSATKSAHSGHKKQMSALGGKSGHDSDLRRCLLLTPFGHWPRALTDCRRYIYNGCPFCSVRTTLPSLEQCSMRRREFVTLVSSAARVVVYGARATGRNEA